MPCPTRESGRAATSLGEIRAGRQQPAASRFLLASFLLVAVAFAACGTFGSNRERCQRKCGDDEAIYDPDDDTCFCRTRE